MSYPATIVATLLLFPQHPEFAGVVVTILAFGDGSAFIGGKLFGRQPLPWNAKKTWVGSICFFFCSAPIATFAYWLEANHGLGGIESFRVPFALAALCGSTAALAGAIVESLPTQVNDNLRVGVASSLAVVGTHFLFADWLIG